MDALVNINGKITTPENARVSVFDRGFLFGDGVYETGRSYDRCVLFLEEHWRRLRLSASKLSIPVPWTDDELTEGLFATARQFGAPDLYFRTIITRGMVDYVGLDVAASTPPTLVHIIQALPASTARYREQGIKLVTSRIQRNSAQAQDPNIKTSNYLNSLLALQDAKSRGGDDAVMCDAEGRVTEGTTFSIFGVTGAGALITPALGIGILDSITRRHVLEVAKSFVEIKEGFFSLSEFQACAEIFVASSLREVMPVASWDGHRYPVPGSRTAELYQRFRRDIEGYVSSHLRF